MSETKFSKGPWKVLPEEVDRDYIRIRGEVLGGRYKIANVVTPTHEGAHEREAVETRANAALIACAPEMYELLSVIRATGIHKAFIDALLRSARGES